MRRHFFVKAILALAAIGLLAAGMRGAFRTGWQQGYQAGQADESQEGATPYWGPQGTPFGPGRLGPHMVRFRPFGFLRPLFTFALLLFLFGLIAKAFGFWAWRRAWRATGQDWRGAWSHGYPPRHHPRHHHSPHGRHPWPHGPMPPWCWAGPEPGEGEPEDSASSDEAPTEEQVAKVKPEAGKQES